jgi:hypothetical protein
MRENRAHVLDRRFARKALVPIPGPWFIGPLVAFPRGACGTVTCAAFWGLCRGWIWTEAGESLGVEVADMMETVEKAGSARHLHLASEHACT